MEQTGLPFKDENVFAQGRPRRPRTRDVHLKEDSRLPRGSKLLTDGTSVDADCTIQPSPPVAVCVQAMDYWMEHFALRPDHLPDIGLEYGSYVSLYFEQAAPESILHLALSAFSHALFGRAKQVPRALRDAERLYAMAIAKMNKEVQSPSTEAPDQLLIATMLMGSYEVCFPYQNIPKYLPCYGIAVRLGAYSSYRMLCMAMGGMFREEARLTRSDPRSGIIYAIRKVLLRC